MLPVREKHWPLVMCFREVCRAEAMQAAQQAEEGIRLPGFTQELRQTDCILVRIDFRKKEEERMKKRIISVIMTCVLILLSCAWGTVSEGAGNLTENNVSGHSDPVQVGPVNGQRIETILYSDSDSICTGGAVQSVKINNGEIAGLIGGRLYQIDPAGGGEQAVTSLPCPEFWPAYCPDGQGHVYAVISREKENGRDFLLKKYSPEGEEEVCGLNDFYRDGKDDLMRWNLTADSEGNVFVCSPFGCLLLDGEGRELGSVFWEEEKDYTLEGVNRQYVLACVIEEGERIFILYDRESGLERRIEAYPSRSEFRCAASGFQEGEFVICTDCALYGCSGQGELTRLCTWTDYGVVGDDILAVYQGEEGIHCVVKEDGILIDVAYMENGEEKADQGQMVQQVSRLTLGCIGETALLRRAVAGYNRESGCLISIADYWQEDTEEAVKQLNADIRAGKGPDIIAFEAYSGMAEALGQEGLLEDLVPWMDKSTVIGQEDIVEPLYEALLQEGKLYILPVNFGIETLITNEKWAGAERNWTAEACLESMEKAAKAQPLLDYGMGRQEWLKSRAFYGCQEEGGSGKCDACSRIETILPENYVYNPSDVSRREGGMFWESTVIGDVEGYLYRKSVWGEDSLFTGFPGAEGNGMAFVPVTAYGINGNSGYKEEAWRFVERYFTQSGRESGTFLCPFSSDRKVLEEQFREALAKDSETPLITYMMKDEAVDVYPAKQEDIDKIREMIEGTARVRW